MFNVIGRRLIKELSLLIRFMRTRAFVFVVSNAVVLSRVFRGHWSMC